MAGTNIWLDDATYLQTAGQLWAQQQVGRVQAGHDWAQQAIQSTMQQLQSMVPNVPTPAPAAPIPPPAPPPTPAAAPAPTSVPSLPQPIASTPAPTPDVSAPAPVATPAPPPTPPTPPVPQAPTDLASAGENWAQQQIQNLLNPPSTPPQGTPETPASPLAIPGLPPPGGPPAAISGPSPTLTPTPPPAATPAGAPPGPQPNQPGDLIDQARQAAARYGIDPEVFTRQIQQESGFDPTARSPAGAVGIAQFMPGTAQGMGIDPTNPQQSLDAAAKLDSQNLQKYGGDWSKTLAAYNAGPGNVDKYGGVPPFQETQNYVNTILGGAQNLAQQGLSAVNTAVQGVQSQIAARASQFGLGLSSGDAMAFCGPTAAIAFAQTYGRNPTVEEAKQLAQQVGWNPEQGMAGVGSEVKLLNAMGVDAHATQGVDWAQVGRDASGGNPVIIDTPGHYYYVDGYNADTGQLHVGTSGTDLKGGSEWMTPDQINQMPQSEGAARAAVFADHPLAQQDGLAQSTAGAGRQINIGPLSIPIPAPGQSPHPMPGVPGGLVTPPGDYAPAPGSLGPPILDMVNTALPPFPEVPSAIKSKAQDTLQAVLDVGGAAPQSVQDLLNQGQASVSQAPQTVNDILRSNAMLSQGLPSIGGQALEGLQNVGSSIANQSIDLAQYLTSPQSVTDLTQQGPMAGFRQNLQEVGQGLTGALSPAARTQLGQNLEQANLPVLSGLGGMLQAPSALDSMQTLQELNAKYAGTPGAQTIPMRGQAGLTLSVDPAVMTPEDRAAYQQALFAVGGLETPEIPESSLEPIAERLTGGVQPPAVTPQQALNITLGKYPEQVQNVVSSFAQAIPQELGAATRGVLGSQAIRDLSQSTGIDIPQIVSNWNPGQAYNAETLLALRDALAGQGQRVLDAVQTLGANPNSDEARAALMQELAQHASIQQVLTGGTAEAGRALGQFTQPVTGSQAALENLQRMAAQEGLSPDEMVQRVLGVNWSDPRAVSQLAQTATNLGPVTWADRLRLFHTGGVISDLATLSKVAMNSVLNPAWSFGTRSLADLAGVSGLAPGLSSGEALGRFQGGLLGAQSGLAGIGDALAQGLTDVYRNPSSIAARATNPLDQIFGRVFQTPAALHSALQQAGQKVLEQMELGRLAGQQAASEGLTGQAFANRFGQLMRDPLPGWQDSVTGLAQRAVLRGDLGTIGSTMANLARLGPQGQQQSMLGNMLFPVFRVGMNALTQGVEKSPLGLGGTLFDVARATTPLGRLVGEGPYAGGAFQQPVSRAVAPLSERLTNNLIGTALTAWLAQKGLDGTITGDGPSDPDQRRELESSGWRPNSIMTPWGYASYMGTPIEMQAGLAGALGDAVHNPVQALEQQQPVADMIAGRLLANTVNMLGSRTGLETIGQVVDMIHGFQQNPVQAMRQYGTGAIAGTLGSYVPMSGLLRGVARATDPLMRQPAPGDIGQAIAQNIPALRQQVPATLNAITGQPIANPQQGAAAFLPVRLAAGQPNPILDAYQRAGVGISSAPQTVDYGPFSEIRLSPQERLQWQQVRGQILQQSLAQTTADPKFQQSSLKNQEFTLRLVDQLAANMANLQIAGSVASAAKARGDVVPRPGSLTAPVQGYQPGVSSFDPMAAILGGQTGLQALQAAQQRRDAERQALTAALLGGG